MTMRVVMTAEAKQHFGALPVVVRARVAEIVARLERWPDVSGAKPLRHALKGHYRIRTGDWRVLFRVVGTVVIVRIEHRSKVYED